MTFLYDWFSNNITVWEKFLKKFKNRKNLSFLEIGCFEGQSTLWLLENILTQPNSKIVVIDTFAGGDDQKHFGVKTGNLLKRFKENLKDYISEDPEENKVIIKKGFSSEILKKLEGKFDFIYIDGSHIAKDVLEDAVLSWELLNDNGIMIFDDYSWDRYNDETLNPRPAINCFLRIYKGWYKILYAKYQVVIQKKSQKENNDKFTKVTWGNLISLDTQSKEQRERYMELFESMNEIKDSKIYIFWKIYCWVKKYLKLTK